MKNRIISAAVLAVLLTACGGDKKSSNPKPESPPVQTTTSSKITLDSSVPNATRTKITEIVTPLGETAATGGIVPTVAARSTVMALDKDGQIVMLGSASGNSPAILNAESTAIEMVRLLWSQNSDLTDVQLDNYIRATTNFKALVNSVEIVLKSGSLVSDDQSTLQQAIIVTNQLVDGINAANEKMEIKAATKAKYLPIDPSVQNPLPFDVIKPTSSFFGKVDIDQSFKVVNTLPIAWDMRSLDYSGKILGGGDQRLPSASWGNRASTWLNIDGYKLLGVLTGYILDVEIGEQATAQAAHDKSTFQFQIFQSDSTRVANTVEIATDTILTLIDAIGIEGNMTKKAECRAAFVKVFTTSQGFGLLASSKTSEDFFNNFKKMAAPTYIQKAITPDFHALEGCVIAGDPIDVMGEITKMIGAKMNLIYNAYKVTTTGLKVVALLEKISVMGHYNSWSLDNPLNPPLTVCIGKDKKISNCAENIEIKQKKPVVPTAGAEFSLHDFNYFDVIAKDVSGKQTLIPNKVIYQSSQPSIATIDDTGKIKTLKEGVTEISLLDPATGVTTKQPYKLTVYKPTFNNSEVKLAVNESVTLPLQNEKGQNITHNGLTQWGKLPTDIIYFSPEMFTNPKQTTNQTGIVIKGLKAGDAGVKGVNLADGSNVDLKVKVGDTDEHWVIKYTIKDCTPFPEYGAYAGVGDDRYRGWLSVSPCFSAIPFYGYTGEIKFDPNESEVYLYSGNGYSEASVKSLPLQFSPTQDAYSVSLSDGIFFEASYYYGCIQSKKLTFHKEWNKSINLNVTKRNSDGSASGIFTIDMQSVLFDKRKSELVCDIAKQVINAGYGSSVYELLNTISTTASGTWTLERRSGKVPTPKMNGYYACTYEGRGYTFDSWIRIQGTSEPIGSCKYE